MDAAALRHLRCEGIGARPTFNSEQIYGCAGYQLNVEASAAPFARSLQMWGDVTGPVGKYSNRIPLQRPGPPTFGGVLGHKATGLSKQPDERTK